MTNAQSPYVIPTFLIGNATKVRPRWRRVVKRAMKDQTWANAIKTMEFIDIDRAPGCIQIAGPMHLLTGDNVVVWLMLEELWTVHSKVYPENQTTDEPLKKLMLEGLDHFWFALGILSDGSFLWAKRSQEETKAIAEVGLRKLLVWWPEFCRLASRFAWGMSPERLPVTWPLWGALGRKFGRDLGVSEVDLEALQRLDPLAAGQQMQRWLEGN